MKKTHTIAIIGGGFSGLCAAANLIRLLRTHKKYADITVFDEKGLRGGRIFSPDLPHNFTLNHEAEFMGAINANAPIPGNDDFFLWIQEHIHDPLKSMNGKTIAQQYTTMDIRNPKAHLPRSLYGHYLEFRLKEMQTGGKSKHHSFSYVLKRVVDIKKFGKKISITLESGTKLYDTVIIATGFWFKSSDTSDAVYKKEFTSSSHRDPIGIIGSSLSAVELALSLIEQGHRNIKLFSRNGRLPKVRGDVAPYTPAYLTNKTLEKVMNQFGNFEAEMMFYLVKKEFDRAYEMKNAGLYQERGINWKTILGNEDPVKQLKEDIRSVSSGEELVWRSVLQSVYEYENQLWRGLRAYKRGEIASKYSSLLLSYIAPMPLLTAKSLYKNLQKGRIQLVSQMRGYEKDSNGYLVETNKGTEFITHLIDGRGPSKDISQNAFLTRLIQSGLLEKSSAGGVLVNNHLQAMRKNKAHNNVYLSGPMTYGERPHNSTVFAGEYAEMIAGHITRNIQHADVVQANSENMYEQLNQLLLTMQETT